MKLKKASAVINMFKEFFHKESSSGIILIMCALTAVIISNSSLNHAYEKVLHTNIALGMGKFFISMSILHWINDGLMSIFFLLVGMEIKREVLVGELKTIKKVILPIGAALGGMVVPAIIYFMVNFGQNTVSGWGIPMATDIAFALGVISLVGNKKAPRGIVVFLTALAIVDDLGAIIVIAIFYTNNIRWLALLIGVIAFVFLIIANKLKVRHISAFIILGFVLWICLLKSGVHATIAGVLLGISIPLGKTRVEAEESAAYKLEHLLNYVSAYGIMPIFALANSGVIVNINSFKRLMISPVSIGIALGLFCGKQLGIFGMSWLFIKFKIAKLPSKVSIKHLYGASVLGGIGFTMSLFISSLSFSNAIYLNDAKVAIMSVSIISSILGFLIFKLMKTKNELS
ncbi:Na+/H+ antiporter NhaA [Clostridium guangxiense]|uniref:Na+/H+ antiporter NhaA n=1 Tax=Clostridium guangxiense TaxID=1662055 RepID=UPI001E48417A|nr:Na+/H+ antiporter NhaA [Clostridium guangxiense]MCD2345733.1 Na+/H+ antiporter NhaA [Clostridium guangxiense]